jgi:uncharacterized protein (DUF1015 family)
MAKVYPFRALRYDPARVAPQQVVTQPYDKITPQMQERYYARDPHNLVRIELGKKHLQDNESENVYTRAATDFRAWRQSGIFRQDAQPSLYSYVQRFSVPGSGREQERRGFIGLGQLEDYSAGVVFRHEQTLARPKADRLELLRATRAHFGQLFMVYSDLQREIERVLSPAGPPDIDLKDEYGVCHQVWKVSDAPTVQRVTRAMADKKLIIADGHHRYETALAYRNERREEARTVAASAGGSGSSPAAAYEAPYERVMMTFVNMDNPGLIILPTHRVIQGLPSFSSEAFIKGAADYFDIEEVTAGLDEKRAAELLRDAGHKGTVLLVLTAGRAFLFQSRPGIGRDRMGGLSSQQQELDVVKLHKLLLEGVLRISEEEVREQKYVTYFRDTAEAMAKAKAGADAVFLMNSARMEQVRDIAFAGEVLPQKSTDFYPKLLSGLTVYALD